MAQRSASTHNDQPTLDCDLGRVTWLKTIFEQIKEAAPPKVIAIHGTWGMGKTSALWQLYKDLGGTHQLFSASTEAGEDPDEPVKIEGLKVVWFEAWQYQHEPNILAALLKEIRDQLSMPHKIWEGIKEGSVVGTLSLLESVSHTFDNFAGIFGGISMGSKGLMTKIKENTQDYQRRRFATPLDSVMLKKQLQDAISKLLNIGKKEKEVKKAVIFIDDLDRCEPEIAFRILETIKVYLNLNNCVFVLGMDIKAVDNIIAHHYQKNLEEDANLVKNRARLYLEKICQDVHPLPVPTGPQRNILLRKLLIDKLPDREEQIDQLVKLSRDFRILPPFPRSIKILANVIITFLNQQKIVDFLAVETRNYQVFLILCYLYAFHLEIYNLCISYEEFYSEFLEFCKAPDAIKGQLENHPELDRIVVHMAKIPAVEDVMTAQTEITRLQKMLIRQYPHENLRQVLWIRKLVLKTEAITPEHLNTLQL